jgi:hypothetical protein
MQWDEPRVANRHLKEKLKNKNNQVSNIKYTGTPSKHLYLQSIANAFTQEWTPL